MEAFLSGRCFNTRHYLSLHVILHACLHMLGPLTLTGVPNILSHFIKFGIDEVDMISIMEAKCNHNTCKLVQI